MTQYADDYVVSLPTADHDKPATDAGILCSSGCLDSLASTCTKHCKRSSSVSERFELKVLLVLVPALDVTLQGGRNKTSKPVDSVFRDGGQILFGFFWIQFDAHLLKVIKGGS